ncbi:major facilitator superfamily domain-containing protein [Myxozyma melibiosi]|uniref:Major facilitator superfamily domain-containing protein n=1 Tax=Myxozyma melibiosi TaxID=54550 RepID=A0ABR1F171_9ASCO
MPFGIIEPPSDSPVPGTVHLYDGLSFNSNLELGSAPISQSRLKRDGDIILVPQPSDSINDPLNWSTRKKDLVLTVLCLASIMSAVVSPLIASVSTALVVYFRKGFGAIALLTGWYLFSGAIVSLFITAIAVKYGKRFPYLLACVILVASSAWAGAATSYKSFLWSRILQGASLAPFEVLVNTSIGDLYFVHQRGYRLAIANLCLFGSTFLAPIIAGHIADKMGWHWLFWFVLIFSSITLILVFFFLPEHVYKRDHVFDTDIEGERDLIDRVAATTTPPPDPNDEEKPEGVTDSTEHPETYLHSLRLFSGSKTDRPLWKIFLRPFVLIFHPGVIFAALTQAPLIAWTVTIGVVLAAIFLGPPLWYTEVNVGNMYTGALIGSLIGFVIAGALSDYLAKLLSRRNNNVYEPEFRVLLVIPQFVCGVVGIWGFGATANNLYKYSKYLPPFFFGVETCGMIIGAVASGAYITDAHRDIQVEAFVVLVLVKNFVSFALTDRAYEWLVKAGVMHCFVVAGSIQCAVSVLTILYYFVGKYCRYWAHRHSLLRALKLD